MTESAPAPTPVDIRRVAIVFAGGPAPAANAVISAAATSFIDLAAPPQHPHHPGRHLRCDARDVLVDGCLELHETLESSNRPCRTTYAPSGTSE
ncbi:MAG: hypothetical protein JNK45_33445 [Myxococcales bacterium]|nr:hypothetical protein [Myxococcales bacterium]